MSEIKDLKLNRIVMEVFGGCNYTCQMCPQSNPGRGKGFTRKMPLKEFKRILDELVPKYGNPQINLEGSGMIGITGFSKRLFEALSDKDINVIMITQASSEHSICIGVKEEESILAKIAIDEKFAFEISQNKVSPARIEMEMVNIAVVGEKMKDHQGISGKLFSSLGANNINIRAIAQGACRGEIVA